MATSENGKDDGQEVSAQRAQAKVSEADAKEAKAKAAEAEANEAEAKAKAAEAEASEAEAKAKAAEAEASEAEAKAKAAEAEAKSSPGQGQAIEGTRDDDVVWGRSGDDTIHGGDGDDRLWGDNGDDQLYGDAGHDRLVGGKGADTIHGGDGADWIIVNKSGDGDGDFVDGGEGGKDFDTLDLTGAGPLNIRYDKDNQENGTVEFLDKKQNVTGKLRFTNIEKVVPCFTAGTRIATAEGAVQVELLQPGQRILTRDGGLQPLRWIGRKDLSCDMLLHQPALYPVCIRQGALGPDMPGRDMLVSPQHRVLIAGARAELMFGEHEVLVAALHLVGRPGIERATGGPVSYLHLLFDRHEIVLSDGAWTESFQPGDRTLAGMDGDQLHEIGTLFPQLLQGARFATARRALRAHEARALFAA